MRPIRVSKYVHAGMVLCHFRHKHRNVLAAMECEQETLRQMAADCGGISQAPLKSYPAAPAGEQLNLLDLNLLDPNLLEEK